MEILSDAGKSSEDIGRGTGKRHHMYAHEEQKATRLPGLGAACSDNC